MPFNADPFWLPLIKYKMPNIRIKITTYFPAPIYAATKKRYKRRNPRKIPRRILVIPRRILVIYRRGVSFLSSLREISWEISKLSTSSTVAHSSKSSSDTVSGVAFRTNFQLDQSWEKWTRDSLKERIQAWEDDDTLGNSRRKRRAWL